MLDFYKKNTNGILELLTRVKTVISYRNYGNSYISIYYYANRFFKYILLKFNLFKIKLFLYDAYVIKVLLNSAAQSSNIGYQQLFLTVIGTISCYR